MEDGRTLLTGYRLTTLTFASDEDEKRHQCLGLKGWPSQPFWRFFGAKMFLLFGNFYVLLSGYMSGLRHCLHSHGSSACWMTYWNLEAAVSQKILYRKNVFLVLGGPSIFPMGPFLKILQNAKFKEWPKDQTMGLQYITNGATTWCGQSKKKHFVVDSGHIILFFTTTAGHYMFHLMDVCCTWSLSCCMLVWPSSNSNVCLGYRDHLG